MPYIVGKSCCTVHSLSIQFGSHSKILSGEVIPFENDLYSSVPFEEPLSASKGLPTPLEDFGAMGVQNDVVGTMPRDQKRKQADGT